MTKNKLMLLIFNRKFLKLTEFLELISDKGTIIDKVVSIPPGYREWIIWPSSQSFNDFTISERGINYHLFVSEIKILKDIWWILCSRNSIKQNKSTQDESDTILVELTLMSEYPGIEKNLKILDALYQRIRRSDWIL